MIWQSGRRIGKLSNCEIETTTSPAFELPNFPITQSGLLPTTRRVTRPFLHSANDQRPRDHVMQGLFALGKTGHDEADHQDEAGEYFCKMSRGGA